MLCLRSSMPIQVALRGLTAACQPYSTGPYVHPNPLVQPKPTTQKFKAKHANPKFRKERARKVFKVDLPNFHEKNENELTPAEIRTKMKERGIQPPRPWNERALFISCTGGAFEPYVPPEGDGKASIATTQGAKQRLERMEKKGRSMLAVRKIRQFDEDFDLKDFAKEALDIYVKLHEALVKYDEKDLHVLATEKAFPLVTNGAKGKTLRWTFHGSLEPPRAVLVRQTHIVTKDNIFAQVTVRFLTQQTLAVYDRFGRLVHGSEHVLRDVLEYVVFEKQVSNVYGTWRVHHKITPPWMDLQPTSIATFRAPTPNVEEADPPAAAATP